jgi:hypothetical protein
MLIHIPPGSLSRLHEPPFSSSFHPSAGSLPNYPPTRTAADPSRTPHGVWVGSAAVRTRNAQ